MKDLVLIGGGGHCKSVIDVVEQEGRFNIIGIIDTPEKFGEKILDYNIIGNDSELHVISKTCKNALISIGQLNTPQLRIKLFENLLKIGFSLPTIISPRAYISKHAIIGMGTIVMHDAVINSDSEIGDNCIINTKSLVEHGSKIESHCHISTGALINGEVTIGKGSFIGSGSVTKHGIKIDKNFFAKSGSVIK